MPVCFVLLVQYCMNLDYVGISTSALTDGIFVVHTRSDEANGNKVSAINCFRSFGTAKRLYSNAATTLNISFHLISRKKLDTI